MSLRPMRRAGRSGTFVILMDPVPGSISTSVDFIATGRPTQFNVSGNYGAVSTKRQIVDKSYVLPRIKASYFSRALQFGT